MSDDRPKPEQDEKGRFVPGNVGGGRPKGARQKIVGVFFEDLLASWEAHGPETIETVRVQRPQDYLKVVASILPKELNIKVSELDELTDDQVAGQLSRVIAQLAAAGLDVIAGIGAETEAQPAPGVPTVQ
ncbi:MULTISPECIES: hypothetical protein [unclassified Sphingomonas]|uniref:hypothetical protein n=1 Tax=unclassified Sphingomonas TaxID=196159 RepID=UPI0009E90CD5|nr:MULTISPECIES: hypothetical protein [unclassified Sphingomonas]